MVYVHLCILSTILLQRYLCFVCILCPVYNENFIEHACCEYLVGEISDVFKGNSVQISHCAAWISQHAYLMWSTAYELYSTPEGSTTVHRNSSVHAVPICGEPG